MTTIIIPAYNEELAIAQVVERSKKYGKVLVVNDGSTDSTEVVAKSAGARVITGKHKGKGAALKLGVSHVNDDVVFIDGDLQHIPEDIPQFLDKLKTADIVIGVRKHTKDMPFHRRVSNRLSTFAVNWLTGYNLHDSQSGFRAIKKTALKELSFESSGFEIETEMIVEASKAALTVAEVPIHTIYEGRASHFNIVKDGKAIVSMILSLVKASFRRK